MAIPQGPEASLSGQWWDAVFDQLSVPYGLEEVIACH